LIETFLDYFNQMQEILANNTFQEYGVIGLFFNSLLSATAIPLPTEILTSALLLGGESRLLVGIVLVIGSTLGGLINYGIGFGGNKLFSKFKKKDDEKEVEEKKKGNKILDKFGWGAIFFAAWIPVIGDFILISAGAKKMRFGKFILFMVSGKAFKVVITILGIGLMT